MTMTDAERKHAISPTEEAAPDPPPETPPPRPVWLFDPAEEGPPAEPDPSTTPVEPGGLVELALRELGARVVRVDDLTSEET